MPSERLLELTKNAQQQAMLRRLGRDASPAYDKANMLSAQANVAAGRDIGSTNPDPLTPPQTTYNPAPAH